MTSIGELLQATLDTVLNSAGVRSYWQRKAETTGETPQEYLVYTMNGDAGETFADDGPLLKVAGATLKYYYCDALMDTKTGRDTIKTRTDTILGAVEAAGFTCAAGPFDAGDIDDIGFGTRIFELDYRRVV